MPRIRDPNRDKAYEVFKKHDGNIDLVEIANQLNMPPGTIRGWKSKDKWEQKLNGTLQKERNAPKGKSPPSKVKNNEPLQEVEQNEDSSDLTDKQRLFCLYYIQENFNKTKAYMKAYECNYDTARTAGARMFTNVCVRKEVDRLTEEALADVGVNTKLLAQKLFEQYMSIAFSDIKDYLTFGKKTIEYVDKKGLEHEAEISYVDLNESSEVDGTIVTEVKQGKDGVSIKLADKMKAMEWLSEHTELATDEQKLKLALLKAKVTSIDEDEEQEDDGFVEALKGQVNDVWEE